MKTFFLFLLLPVLSIGQTIHVKEKKIVYEGSEKMDLPVDVLFSSIQKTLSQIIGGYRVEEQSGNLIKARGELKLSTPYHLIHTVQYSIKVSATAGGYQYTIDSVSFVEQERGEKPITRSSTEVLENMGETGKIVGDTEKILNETDMKFQNLLALLRSKMKKRST